MTDSTKREQRPQTAGHRIVQVAKKLGEWVIQGAASGIAREVMQYALDLWAPM